MLGTYFALGVDHILRGIDHLMFVFALILLVRDRRALIGAVTAFTVAHSLSLAAAALGLDRRAGATGRGGGGAVDHVPGGGAGAAGARRRA